MEFTVPASAAKAQHLFEKYGIEIILLSKRIDFKMPFKKWTGKGAQFPVAWYTWGLNIGNQLNFGKIRKYPNEQMAMEL